jgi:hypothetical protein
VGMDVGIEHLEIREQRPESAEDGVGRGRGGRRRPRAPPGKRRPTPPSASQY